MKIAKSTLLILFVSLLFGCNAQLSSGFSPNEARDMIQICNSFSYIDLHGSDKAIIPEKYQKIYTSPSYGMDNKFQIYTHNDEAVIHFRGSTDKAISWMENLFAAMIPAKGEIKINDEKFSYHLGDNESSYVHAGYTLAIYYLKGDLINQIEKLNEKGIYSIFITGHSQGAALSQLIMAYLNNLPNRVVSSKNKFKVYAFASPMIGNPSFINEYNKKFCASKWSFVLNNPKDIVTKMPISYNDSTFWKNHIIDVISDGSESLTQRIFLEGLLVLFNDKITTIAKKMSKKIQDDLFEELGAIEMPAYSDDFNYSQTGNLVVIQPTEYPLVLKDSTILENDSLMRTYEKEDDGAFKNKSLYEKQGIWMQHKAYNYYTAVLKAYFPDEYKTLDKKYFIHPDDSK